MKISDHKVGVICYLFLVSVAEALIKLLAFKKIRKYIWSYNSKQTLHLCFETRSKYFKAFSLNTVPALDLVQYLIQHAGWDDWFLAFSENFYLASFKFPWVLLWYCLLCKYGWLIFKFDDEFSITVLWIKNEILHSPHMTNALAKSLPCSQLIARTVWLNTNPSWIVRNGQAA